MSFIYVKYIIILICIIFIIFSVRLYFDTYDLNLVPTNGIIKSIYCYHTIKNRYSTTQQCYVKIGYDYEDSQYETSILINGIIAYDVGNIIPIYVNKINPIEITYYPVSQGKIAFFVVFFSIIIIIITIFSIYTETDNNNKKLPNDKTTCKLATD